jgi:hypothetical protein
MNNQGSLNKSVEYGRKLIHAGVTGIEEGERSGLQGQAMSSFLLASTRDSLTLALAGACVGLLGCQLMNRRVHPLKVLGWGALAFATGFGWRTRKLGVSAAQSALKEVSKIRDEHWLELNPIDYA